MDPLLLMQNVEKSFGAVKALDGVRFEVPPATSATTRSGRRTASTTA